MTSAILPTYNFIASMIDIRSGLLDGPYSKSVKNYEIDNPGLERVTGDRLATLIGELGKDALNPNSVVLWDQSNEPSVWGNIKGAGDIRRSITEFGTAVNTIYYFVPSSAVYLSVNQYNYWAAAGVDMTFVES